MTQAKGLLIDTTRCIGCRGCQVACKQWNRLPALETAFDPDMTNPQVLSAATWTHIAFSEDAATSASPAWDFVKHQCLHCLDAGCVAACPVGALRRTAEGAIVHKERDCMGCRYCMLACPYQIPKFEWEKTASVVRKCTLCYDRLATGKVPACAQTCPTGATSFGGRIQLIREAEKRLRNRPDKYVQQIYGCEAAGGTAVLYISDVPFAQLGLKTPDAAPPSVYTWRWMMNVPDIAALSLLALAGLWRITKRRLELDEE